MSIDNPLDTKLSANAVKVNTAVKAIDQKLAVVDQEIAKRHIPAGKVFFYDAEGHATEGNINTTWTAAPLKNLKSLSAGSSYIPRGTVLIVAHGDLKLGKFAGDAYEKTGKDSKGKEFSYEVNEPIRAIVKGTLSAEQLSIFAPVVASSLVHIKGSSLSPIVSGGHVIVGGTAYYEISAKRAVKVESVHSDAPIIAGATIEVENSTLSPLISGGNVLIGDKAYYAISAKGRVRADSVGSDAPITAGLRIDIKNSSLSPLVSGGNVSVGSKAYYAIYAKGSVKAESVDSNAPITAGSHIDIKYSSLSPLVSGGNVSVGSTAYYDIHAKGSVKAESYDSNAKIHASEIILKEGDTAPEGFKGKIKVLPAKEWEAYKVAANTHFEAKLTDEQLAQVESVRQLVGSNLQGTTAGQVPESSNLEAAHKFLMAQNHKKTV